MTGRNPKSTIFNWFHFNSVTRLPPPALLNFWEAPEILSWQSLGALPEKHLLALLKLWKWWRERTGSAPENCWDQISSGPSQNSWEVNLQSKGKLERVDSINLEFESFHPFVPFTHSLIPIHLWAFRRALWKWKSSIELIIKNISP